MIALKAWLLAAALAAGPGSEGDSAPPVELLEFIGDWTAEEQKLIDQAVNQAAKPGKKPVKPRSKTKDDGDEAATTTRSGPPR